ncbi:helix-turn-helix transcriptional regulator [Mycobacterium sp. CPCC 205372]|uniref:Helix-turn-helix transcriptional regulator n=1 Tax=Mycobacterium hippophais TaxID=3016340 RepID=A0ABT4PY27_9MYCO|nr:helix-turn-helix transcriptional regulator [Mycobacterium hippophais]MCZ8381488.1 helix-turn-helix transcriptional regulator [Mycobacterium hippophais]
MTTRDQLSAYLRSRRARLSPADVGLPTSGRRRTPGLRREEVAVLAGVGVSWYTWLEQGRDITVSADVLDAVARTLRLDPHERAHLYVLAGMNPPLPDRSGEAVTAEVRRLLDTWPAPAVVRDRHWRLLAFNGWAETVFGYRDADENCLVTFFTSIRYRDMRMDWDSAAPAVVAAFRADAALFPEDREFGRLVQRLRSVSAEFAELWGRHDVTAPAQTVKAVRHPAVGELYFDTTTLLVADHPDWHLELSNPLPGTDTRDRLDRLPSLVV